MTAALYDGHHDRYNGAENAQQPARLALAVTPNDTLDLTDSVAINDNLGMRSYAKALYIGVAGDVAIIAADDRSNGGQGTAVTFKAHPVGYMPVQVRRVMNTNTTATNMLALID